MDFQIDITPANYKFPVLPPSTGKLIPFTFDDLPVGYLYDREIVKEADNNKEYSVEDIYKGSNYLIMEQCHPCFDDIEILNPENLPEEIQSFYNGEEDLLR